MFKKFRNALTEVTEEVKANPRFQNLNNLAAQTYSYSLNAEGGGGGGSTGNSVGLSSEAFLREDSNSEFFSLGQDHTLGETATSLEDDMASLFPVYEAPTSVPHVTELESATDVESSLASEASSVVSKEQLLSMLSRSRSRATKYKSHYSSLAKAYKDIQSENQKISNVMQQTQDKALRRISELREQCSLSQKAKQHLEEELRGDMEEKEHIIKTLETKVALLKSGGELLSTPAKNGDEEGPLVVIDIDEKPNGVNQEKMIHLEEKVKRLENLLTKCKESITANKQKISALVEVKESLSKQISEKTQELTLFSSKFEEEVGWLKKERDEALRTCEEMRSKDQNEELLLAESKLVVHQRELRILEDEMKAKLVEKDNENRLALEEAQLRIKSLVKAEEKKNELLCDLENKLKALSRDKSSKDREIEGLSKELESLKRETDGIQKSSSDREEVLNKEISTLRSQDKGSQVKIEELNKIKFDLLSQIESKEALIRGLEETQSSEDSLERRYYNESLPDMIQSKEDEISKLKEESKLEINVLKEELSTLKIKNTDLRNKNHGDNPLAQELESKKQEITKLESELGNLLVAKQDLEGAFNAYKAEQETIQGDIRKQIQSQNMEALAKKDELIKDISLESSNEMEKLKKELNVLKTSSETDLENLKSINETKISKIQTKNEEAISKIQEKHTNEIEEMNGKISELRQGKNVEFLEENGKLQKSLASLEEKFKSLSDELADTVRQKTQAQKNLEEKLHELDRMKESQKALKDLESPANDNEKEIISLRERERSQKDLEAQMIRYQKELLSEIKRMEDVDKEKTDLIHELKIESENKYLENKKNAERFDRQVSDLKQDLEMKIRLERDRENAHTELKRQSIEYQKKLQEQLQEKESFLRVAKEEISCFEGKMGNLNNLHTREIERLSSRILELTQTVKELEERRDCDIDITENMLKECDILKEDNKEKDDEITQLRESKTSLIELLKEEQSKSCQDCSSLKESIKSLEETKESLRQQLQENDSLTNDRDSSHQSLISEKDMEIKTLRESNDFFQQQIQDKNSLLTDRDSSQQSLGKKVSEKDEEIKRLKEVTDSLQEEVRNKKSLINDKDSSQKSLEIKISENNEEIKKLLESELELQESLNSQATSLCEKETSLKSLTDEIRRLKDTVESVQKEKEELSKISADLEDKKNLDKIMNDLRNTLKEESELSLSELKLKRDEEISEVWRQYEERTLELEGLFDSQRKEYESSIEELSTKVLKLQEENASHSWGGWDHEPIDLQNHVQLNQMDEPATIQDTNHEQQHSIATLKITNNNHRSNSSYGSCSLEEAAEFEYLKNILYQYMLGKESLTLAKVLATVVKFNQEQINKIMLHEEQKKSLLTSFGLNNS